MNRDAEPFQLSAVEPRQAIVVFDEKNDFVLKHCRVVPTVRLAIPILRGSN